jgi:hypothetical protein
VTYGSSYGNFSREKDPATNAIAIVISTGLVVGLFSWIIYLINGGMQEETMCPPGTKEAHGFSGEGYIYLCIEQ